MPSTAVLPFRPLQVISNGNMAKGMMANPAEVPPARVYVDRTKPAPISGRRVIPGVNVPGPGVRGGGDAESVRTTGKEAWTSPSRRNGTVSGSAHAHSPRNMGSPGSLGGGSGHPPDGGMGIHPPNMGTHSPGVMDMHSPSGMAPQSPTESGSFRSGDDAGYMSPGPARAFGGPVGGGMGGDIAFPVHEFGHDHGDIAFPTHEGMGMGGGDRLSRGSRGSRGLGGDIASMGGSRASMAGERASMHGDVAHSEHETAWPPGPGAWGTGQGSSWGTPAPIMNEELSAHNSPLPPPAALPPLSAASKKTLLSRSAASTRRGSALSRGGEESKTPIVASRALSGAGGRTPLPGSAARSPLPGSAARTPLTAKTPLPGSTSRTPLPGSTARTPLVGSKTPLISSRTSLPARTPVVVATALPDSRAETPIHHVPPPLPPSAALPPKSAGGLSSKSAGGLSTNGRSRTMSKVSWQDGGASGSPQILGGDLPPLGMGPGNHENRRTSVHSDHLRVSPSASNRSFSGGSDGGREGSTVMGFDNPMPSLPPGNGVIMPLGGNADFTQQTPRVSEKRLSTASTRTVGGGEIAAPGGWGSAGGDAWGAPPAATVAPAWGSSGGWGGAGAGGDTASVHSKASKKSKKGGLWGIFGGGGGDKDSVHSIAEDREDAFEHGVPPLHGDPALSVHNAPSLHDAASLHGAPSVHGNVGENAATGNNTWGGEWGRLSGSHEPPNLAGEGDERPIAGAWGTGGSGGFGAFNGAEDELNPTSPDETPNLGAPLGGGKNLKGKGKGKNAVVASTDNDSEAEPVVAKGKKGKGGAGAGAGAGKGKKKR